ncbi:hypothetical protein DNTS_001860 [Danionella cerebrum]|uniref:Uncharacterized protein n=1 Tax=Danionella cerebrum TaxID=2873325 RepID=A0A553QIP7_9TELE|nr:hypothetical protein DNTS_001860 [Danionella translucida]
MELDWRRSVEQISLRMYGRSVFAPEDHNCKGHNASCLGLFQLVTWSSLESQTAEDLLFID